MAEIASTLAAAATAVGSAASAAAPFAALASAGLGVVSAISQSNSMQAQAQQQRLSTQLELNKGRQDSLTIRRNLTRNLAASAASYAGRGLSLGSGTPETMADALTTDAGFAQSIAGTNSTIRAESSNLAASNLEARAGSTLTTGLIGGALGLVNFVGGYADRQAGSAGVDERVQQKIVQSDPWGRLPSGSGGG